MSGKKTVVRPPLTTRQLKIISLLERADSDRLGGYHVDSVATKLRIDGGFSTEIFELRELEARGIVEQYRARVGGTVLWRIKREKPVIKESMFS